MSSSSQYQSRIERHRITQQAYRNSDVRLLFTNYYYHYYYYYYYYYY